MKNKFKLLRNADDEIIDTLSENYFNISKKEKDRMFAMSEKKVNDMKAKDFNSSSISTENDRPEILTIEKRNPLYKPFRAAGVCFALVIAVVAAAAGLHGIENGNVDTIPESSTTGALTDENIIVSMEDTRETAFEESTLETTGASEKDEDAVYNENFDYETAHDNETSSASDNSSSNKKDSVSESIVESDVDIKTSVSTVTAATDKGEASSPTDLQEISDPDIPFTSSEETAIEYDDKTFESYGTTTEKKILSITADMSYDTAIKTLGEPETVCITNGYAQYIVDDTKLLMIHYSDKNELIGISGSELFESCVELSELKSDFDNFTFDCYVIACDGTVRVTCPQYSVLGGCTDLWFSSGFDKSAIKVGDKLRITYTGDVLESYPPIIDVTEVIFE